MSVSIFDHVPINGGHHEFALDGTEQQPSANITLAGDPSYLMLQSDVDFAARFEAFEAGDQGFSRAANSDYMLSRNEWSKIRVKASATGKLILQEYKR